MDFQSVATTLNKSGEYSVEQVVGVLAALFAVQNKLKYDAVFREDFVSIYGTVAAGVLVGGGE